MRHEAFFENIRVGIDALRARPLRTALSVTGITIGSAALIAMMALSEGMLTFAREQVARQTSVQRIVVSPRRSRYVSGHWVAASGYPHYSAADAASLASWTGATASLRLGGDATLEYRGRSESSGLTLGTAAMVDGAKLALDCGRFFAITEERDARMVIVIDHALATNLSRRHAAEDLLGATLRVNGWSCVVIGVLEARRFEDRGDPSYTVIAPVSLARRLLAPGPDGRYAPAIDLVAPSVASVADVHERTLEWLARRDPQWESHVQVALGREQLERVEQAFLLMRLFTGAIVGLALLVGGIGIMNTLLSAIVERTREIGIRKSVGATRADIRLQFLSESVAIALAGSLAGCLLGAAGAELLAWAFRSGTGAPVSAVFAPSALLGSCGASAAIGLVFGTLPAERASRLTPIAALAHE